jgi:hypothetical protein
MGIRKNTPQPRGWPSHLNLAFGFIYHGIPKFTPAGHQLFLSSLQGMGVPLAEPMSWLIGVLEVGGALLLLVGYQVRLVAVPRPSGWRASSSPCCI